MSEAEAEKLTPQQELDLEAEEHEKLFMELAKGKVQDPSADDDEEDGGTPDESEESPDDEDHDDGDQDDSPKRGTKKSDKTPAPSDPKFAWIEELPEKFREQAMALAHSERSNRGRVAALNSRLTEYQAELDTRAKLGRQTKETSSGKTESEELPQSLKEFAEKYPALAENVKALSRWEMNQLQKQIDEKISPIQQNLEKEKRKEALQRLEQGAAELFDTANTGIHYREDVITSDAYRDWLSEQPADFRQIATTTNDPDTALWVLKHFARDAEDFYKKSQSKTDADKEDGNEADRVRAQRKRAKDSAGAVRPTTPPSRLSEAANGDYDKLFLQMNKHTLPDPKNRRK